MPVVCVEVFPTFPYINLPIRLIYIPHFFVGGGVCVSNTAPNLFSVGITLLRVTQKPKYYISDFPKITFLYYILVRFPVF